MKIILAPMDGITDFYVRQLLTSVGGYDLSITEFLRVTESVFPKRIFYQTCPEINPDYQLDGKTQSGTPVILQLLGNHSGYLAANAYKAAELGVSGIDLNFGCPSNSVNRRGSGAILLNQPDKIYQLVEAVKQALPEGLSLSAKMRLGYEDSSLALENALAIAAAGADFLTVHARTKKDAYRPPAKWDEVTNIIKKLSIPVVMNGEIWNIDDYKKCHKISQCNDIMLGRGAFAKPDLAIQIKQQLSGLKTTSYHWEQVIKLLNDFYLLMINDKKISEKHLAGRIKLWVKWLMVSYSEAEILFEQIKSLRSHQQIVEHIMV
ncbi:MAG: tRNA-dihydrouridine synthase [Pseudomonadota bacterium]